MPENNKLFSIEWYAPKDSSKHRFLLFAPNVELARVFAAETLRDKGLVSSVDELRSGRVKQAEAGSRISGHSYLIWRTNLSVCNGL